MGKEEKLNALYSEFITGKQNENTPIRDPKRVKMVCKWEQECEFDPTCESCWTPWTGDGKARFMVVAEAPSTRKKGSEGPCVAPPFNKVKDSKSDLSVLAEFIDENFTGIPYFTDVLKCGISNQTSAHKKAKFEKRFDKCRGFLEREIEILDPEFIIAVGSYAREKLKIILTDMQRPNVEVINLLHYSRNAALPVTTDEKKDLIWPLQLQDWLDKPIKNKDRLSNLKYFKNIK